MRGKITFPIDTQYSIWYHTCKYKCIRERRKTKWTNSKKRVLQSSLQELWGVLIMRFEKNPHALYSRESIKNSLEEADKLAWGIVCDMQSLCNKLDRISCRISRCSEKGDESKKAIARLEKSSMSIHEAIRSIRDCYKSISTSKNIISK